eukprot:s2398_g5.t1
MLADFLGPQHPCVGDDIDGVYTITEKVDGMLFSSQRVPDGLPVVILGADLPIMRVSIYGGHVIDDSDVIFIQITPSTWWKPVPEPKSDLSPHLVDLCAGTGAMSIGAKFLGGSPMIAVDWNDLAVHQLSSNHAGHVMQIDITTQDSARKIHQACTNDPGTVFLGFPCQPHSVQGLQQGCKDPRADVLKHGLRIAFMIQAQSMILECTPAAGTNPEVCTWINQIAAAMNWKVLTTELDLQEVWPCRRHRWWALLLPHKWTSVGLPTWAFSTPFSTIGDILADWGSWNPEEERQLQLTPHEVQCYGDIRYGHDKRLLTLDDVAATVLHSYANALQDCPCGCRHRGFHPLTLLKGGLRGFFVLSKQSGQPRFLHPRELGLLLGLPDTMHHLPEVRASLCLQGLLASPLQVIWVYGHLKLNHATVHQLGPQPDAAQWILAYCHELLQQLRMNDGMLAPPVRSLDLQTSSASISMQVFGGTTIRSLLQAERITLNWNECGILLAGGHRLGLDVGLRDAMDLDLCLHTEPGPPERLLPTQPVVIAIQHREHHCVHLVQPGTFIFEILHQLTAENVLKVITTEGIVHGVDLRVWHPMSLRTLTEAPWHLAAGFFRCANGFSTSGHLGLHDGHIWQGLQTIAAPAHSSELPALQLHPALAQAILVDTISIAHQQHLRHAFHHSSGLILCIFEAAGHWTLLTGQLVSGSLAWHFFDGLDFATACHATQLATKISGLLGLDFCPLQLHCHIRQLHPHTCGTVALCHLFQTLNPGFMVPATRVLELHHWIWQHLACSGSIFATGITTLSPDQISKLRNLLSDHGVPQSQLEARTNLVIQKLGAPAIIAAFVSKNCWAQLKVQANKPAIALRLVLPDELARHAEKTATTKYGAGISNHKSKKKIDKGPSPLPQPDPADLLLRPGHFKDADGDEVPQIPLESIEAEAHGIAIATATQCQQWLQQRDSISTQALAILLLEELPPDQLEKYQASKVSFPVTYKGTGEPMLIFGTMKTLGDQPVNRHTGSNVTKLEIVANIAIRIHVYRDELQAPWQDLVQSPVRQLCALIPKLQLCAGEGCGHDCPKSHQPVGDHLDSIIMEVWGRSFGKVEGGRAPAPDATYFSVFIRIPEAILKNLLQTHIPGIYYDPRQANAPDDRYRIIWLPARNLAEAQHACKTCLKALGLVRMRNKYGLRVEADDEEAAFKQLKPEATFVATRVQRVFQLFPLPHGIQRAGIKKLLKDIGWLAKPLQPGRGQQDGMSWQVGSSEAPPVTVFTSFDREVLVTEITKPVITAKAPPFVASYKTQKHLRTEASSSNATAPQSDPWQDAAVDPWRTWKPTTDLPTAGKSTSGKRHLAEITGQLREELHASMRKELEGFKPAPDVEMDASATEERFQRIESTMGEIQAQQSQFTQWCTQMQQSTTATESAIQTIHYTLNTHQADLQGLHTEVKSVSDTLGSTFQKSLASHQADMAADFAARFDKLEAMMAKKHRSE